MLMGTDREQEQDQEKYSFMQESIKDEDENPQKSFRKIIRAIGLGLLFGFAACVGFFALKPWAESVFQKQPDQVEIPEDEDKDEDQENDNEELQGTQTEPIMQELTLENHFQLNDLLREVSEEIKKSIVTIDGIGLDESWGSFQDQEDTTYQASGVIVADNGRELLVLVNFSGLRGAEWFRATFADGSEHEAVLKQKNENTDMAVFCVAKNGISTTTMNSIIITKMGNSNILKQGSGLIVVGNLFGVEDGLEYGIASTVNYPIVRADGRYSLIVTDIPWMENASGAMFNYDGELVGMIDSNLKRENDIQTMSSVGISSLKKEIELMSNGKNVPYVGVVGIVVTEKMSETYGIPTGLFVESVEVDSPAMKAGIQRGDIITEADGKEVDSTVGYYNIVMGQEPGKVLKIKGKRQGAEAYVDIQFDVTVGVKN